MFSDGFKLYLHEFFSHLRGNLNPMNNTEQKTTYALNALLTEGIDEETYDWYVHLLDFVSDEQSGNFSGTLFEDEIILCDTETTGTNPNKDSLIQIAAAKVCGGKILDQFETFVNPGFAISEEIVELTGITNDMVQNAPDPGLAVEQFAQFVGNRDLVAHNAPFDKAFVLAQAQEGAFVGTWIDTLAFSRIVFPHFKSHRLGDLAKAFALHKPTHSAIDDVETLVQLWNILLYATKSLPFGLAGAIAQISPDTRWSLRRYFSQAAQSAKQDFDLRRCRREHIKYGTQKDSGLLPVPTFPNDEEIVKAFTAYGVAGKMYPKYEQRAEQVDMALQVTHALRDASYRIIEAGTGVGKSMAYLLPSALVAKQNDITIGVATKTNALLDQLIYNELPRLSKVLGGLSYVALKGYNHYPCLRKIESFVRNEKKADVAVVELFAMLLSYVSRISWGDLDTLNVYWKNLPRFAFEANSNDCLKNKCPFSRTCFVRGARFEAQNAHIVVTNHSLLFRDAEAKASGFEKGLLPPIKNWIVDEAHASETEARDQFSESISAFDLQHQIIQLISSRSGLVKAIQNKASSLEGGGMLYAVLADVELRCSKIQDYSEVFFTVVKDLSALAKNSGAYERLTLWVSPQIREEAAFQVILEPGQTLLDALSGLIARLRDLVSISEQFEELTIQRATLTGIVCALQGMAQALDLVLSGDDDSYVYSIEINTKPDKFTEQLFAQKIDIGNKLSYMFYPYLDSVVFTSATLATGDNKNPFAYFKRSVGLDKLESGKDLEELQLHSSYDFEHNMHILLPKNMPEPNSFDYLESLKQLLSQVHIAMGGSVLTLFTNRSQMEQLYYQLKPILTEQGIELRAQTRGTSVKGLRDRFVEDKALSIFALRSFWEGFDAPGDTLRCVVIPRIPFGRPDEPLACERNLREGKSAWMKYSLPEAVMDLKQAAGRLIRSEKDSGFLVLADSRLQTKNYGRTFLNAMPTKNITYVEIDKIGQVIKSSLPKQ